ncbi:putative uncharacterized protein DDB_G0286901 [Helicoverpa zea]|uniref:putative uncharacterized protein DDB_G0286901 n=1 Tax=Helicoverpa zea TaxID=7113 RepID=UPI001F58CBFE|nr:putative uncharacterized protein DDB_G0286901 [Helicoverpa zea]
MILKVFGVLQIILVQIISAHLLTREVTSQNILNNVANIPLETIIRTSRQINDIPVNLPGNANLPVNLPGSANLPLNGLANGLPFRYGMPFGNMPRGNNLPKNFANMPNNFAFNNGMALPNNSPMNLPFVNRNILPQNRWLPNVNGMNNNGLFNNLPNGLSNINNPVTNSLQNLMNVPAGKNNFNLNNLSPLNTLPNNMQIPNGLPNFNNLPCRNILPSMAQNNGLSQNILPNGNLLPSINSQLPLNNFQITGFELANGLADMTRLPRNNPPVDSVNVNGNNLQNYNGICNNDMPQGVNGFSNINNAQTVNSLVNSPNALPTIVPDTDVYQNANSFINSNVLSSNVPYSNGLSVANNNFQNSNMMTVDSQQFVANNPVNHNLGIPNNFVTTSTNVNNLPLNAITNSGLLNNRQFIASAIPEIQSQNGLSNSFLSSNLQYGNIDMPVNNQQYDLYGNANMPVNQNSLADVVASLSNLPNDCQSTLTSNNFNLAQELVKNLQIEGIENMPFLNGLPVAGITETVTILNNPCS